MKHIKGSDTRTTLSDVDDICIQPNAIDLRLDKVFKINEEVFYLSEQDKQHRGSVEIIPEDNDWFVLAPGHYEVVMKNIIDVGSNEAGWVITRSTLNRNGVFLTSGLYDAGYNGIMAAVMHVSVAPFVVQKGTRIGQYLCFDSEALHHYDGSYGLGKEHDEKYNK